MHYRYAIYFIPEKNSILYRLGSALLGYDIYAGKSVEKPSIALPSGISAQELVAGVQHYGLHATVVAPFFLNETSEKELVHSVNYFCQSNQPVIFPRVKVHLHQGFMAVCPAETENTEQTAYTPMQALAAKAVRFFYPLRKAPSDAEINSRLGAGLSTRQMEYLKRWNYPYVFEEYSFHITLTGMVNENDVPCLNTVLYNYLEEALAEPLIIDRLCICRQEVAKNHVEGEKHKGSFTVYKTFLLGSHDKRG